MTDQGENPMHPPFCGKPDSEILMTRSIFNPFIPCLPLVDTSELNSPLLESMWCRTQPDDILRLKSLRRCTEPAVLDRAGIKLTISRSFLVPARRHFLVERDALLTIYGIDSARSPWSCGNEGNEKLNCSLKYFPTINPRAPRFPATPPITEHGLETRQKWWLLSSTWRIRAACQFLIGQEKK